MSMHAKTESPSLAAAMEVLGAEKETETYPPGAMDFPPPPATPSQTHQDTSGAGFIASMGEDAQFQPAPTGAHPARLYGAVSLGVQESPYGNAHKVLLMWEILGGERKANGEPFTVSKTYTMSMHKKASLRAMVDSWRGAPVTDMEAKRFDVRSLVGQRSLLQVSHRQSQAGRTYANIAGVFPAQPGTEIIPHDMQDIVYDANSEILSEYEKLPGWVQRMCHDRIRP